MNMDRRGVLRSGALGLFAAAAAGLAPRWARALSVDEASGFVEQTIEEVAALLEAPGDSGSKAAKLRAIMEKRAAMPEIARFVAGTAWRGMSEDQQARFVDAFTGFISSIYAGRFDEYAGEVPQDNLFTLGRVTDAGRKGMLVRTTINRAGEAPVVVDWLVTDRPGRPVIADIVIEGVSLLVTQREEIGAMLEARQGNVDKLIEHLASA